MQRNLSSFDCLVATIKLCTVSDKHDLICYWTMLRYKQAWCDFVKTKGTILKFEEPPLLV